MKILKVSQREKLLTIILLTLVLGYGLFQGISRPLSLKQEEMKKDKAVSKKQWIESLKIISQGQEMRKRFEHLQAQMEKSSPQEVLSEMLQTIESSGRQEEVVMVSVNPAPIKSYDVYHQLTVNIEIEGEFVNIMRFIHGIQNHESLFFVKEWQLEPPPSSGTKGKNLLRSRLSLVKMVKKQS